MPGSVESSATGTFHFSAAFQRITLRACAPAIRTFSQ